MKKHFDKVKNLNGRMKKSQSFSCSSTQPFSQPSSKSPPPPTCHCLLILPTGLPANEGKGESDNGC